MVLPGMCQKPCFRLKRRESIAEIFIHTLCASENPTRLARRAGGFSKRGGKSIVRPNGTDRAQCELL